MQLGRILCVILLPLRNMTVFFLRLHTVRRTFVHLYSASCGAHQESAFSELFLGLYWPDRPPGVLAYELNLCGIILR
jgi:hypothetical protein